MLSFLDFFKKIFYYTKSVFRTPDTPENNLYKIGRTIDLKKDYNHIHQDYQKI